MADYRIIDDEITGVIVDDPTQVNQTIKLIPDTTGSANYLKVKALSDNIVKNIIPTGSSSTAPASSTAYMSLFNQLIRCGIKEIDDPTNTDAQDLTCRIYIKYDVS